VRVFSFVASGARISFHFSKASQHLTDTNRHQLIKPSNHAIHHQVWEVPESVHQEGLVIHTVGAPLDTSTYGGGFIYHMDER
jgi:electron-transferring-flavoprotein dehydrogenase